ncbi:uncharacterized protein EAF02_006713 [Botrytis sinoallii]|uniref:uncharacterized protein n=1 Tax=Botrytis sinoallii TaxID=1463999 RepID=UPI0018FFCBE4|nr:uncharacterized protein EAF02_006713 [Botrytis sinoallii]KAF7880822.1 hypothetical protein EAF02_006713 [Botrytis sinoallii]
MEEDEIFQPIKALICDLKKQLEEKDALLKKAKEDNDYILRSFRSALIDAPKTHRKIKELHTTISEKDQTIKDRNITIEKLQKVVAWQEKSCEEGYYLHKTSNESPKQEVSDAGSRLEHWQKGYMILHSVYENQTKELKAPKQTDALKNICEENEALKRNVDNNDRVIAGKDRIISSVNQILADKDRTIAQEALLPSSAQPNSGPVFGSLEVLELADGLNREKKLHHVDKVVQLDAEGKAINENVIEHLSSQLTYICEKESSASSGHKFLEETESFRKPLSEIGLKIRARKLELDFAARTGSTARDNILNPGNFAAHGADAISDAHMIGKFDPTVEVGTESGNATLNRCPGLREQFLLNYIVSPELVFKSSKPHSSQDTGFSYLVYLINWYENLRLWNLDGMVGNTYCMLRKRIKDLVDRISTLEEFVNDDDFEEDEEVVKEFGDLQRIMSKLKAAHRSFRANLSLSRKRSKQS